MKNILKLIISLANILFILQLSHTATIGDGTTSIYTGKSINFTDTRGSCLVDDFRYMSETAITKDHPCHYCICYQAQVTCYWKQCAAPPVNCQVMEFVNECNPSLYICDIPTLARSEPIHEFGTRLGGLRSRRKLFRKRRLTRETRGKMPVEEDFQEGFQKAWNEYVNMSTRKKRAIEYSGGINSIQDTSCTVFGVQYLLGDVIGVASDVCMECRCAAGNMFCSPKCCFLPSPFSVTPQEEYSLFVQTRPQEVVRPPHPLHYVKNQYIENTVL